MTASGPPSDHEIAAAVPAQPEVADGGRHRSGVRGQRLRQTPSSLRDGWRRATRRTTVTVLTLGDEPVSNRELHAVRAHSEAIRGRRSVSRFGATAGDQTSMSRFRVLRSAVTESAAKASAVTPARRCTVKTTSQPSALGITRTGLRTVSPDASVTSWSTIP
jgi:hypothetical protein